jgi:DNA transformation protein and related proteins
MKNTRSLRSSASFERFVLDQLADLGRVTSRKMFGGIGLYCDDVFFGIVSRDALFLKVDDRTRADYEAAGMSRGRDARSSPMPAPARRLPGSSRFASRRIS